MKNMLRYKTERPGLIAFYIQPGNGAGLFLHPRNNHGKDWANSFKLQLSELIMSHYT